MFPVARKGVGCIWPIKTWLYSEPRPRLFLYKLTCSDALGPGNLEVHKKLADTKLALFAQNSLRIANRPQFPYIREPSAKLHRNEGREKEG